MSTKGRYGVRFMMDLVAHREKGNVTLKEVAGRQAISEKYLWHVVTPLKKAGLIRAAAGPGGGYAIAKAPAAITLHEILVALEGDCSLAICTHEPATCPRSNACASRAVWQEVDQKLTQVLESITLSDMAEKQRVMDQRAAKEYCI